MTNFTDKDFIGFSFKGRHSSEFGIVRVSDGSRYNEDLLPSIQDKTVQIPGGHGSYFFSTSFTQKNFPISIAFEDLTEDKFHELRTWLADQVPGELIFDERPYKKYQAKIGTGAQNVKYICFQENGQRIYKGEGQINFICYYPFAKSVYKTKADYLEREEDYPTLNEWINEISLPPEDKIYNVFYSPLSNPNTICANLFNGGDRESTFRIGIKLDQSENKITNFKSVKNGSNYNDIFTATNGAAPVSGHYNHAATTGSEFYTSGSLSVVPEDVNLSNTNQKRYTYYMTTNKDKWYNNSAKANFLPSNQQDRDFTITPKISFETPLEKDTPYSFSFQYVAGSKAKKFNIRLWYSIDGINFTRQKGNHWIEINGSENYISENFSIPLGTKSFFFCFVNLQNTNGQSQTSSENAASIRFYNLSIQGVKETISNVEIKFYLLKKDALDIDFDTADILSMLQIKYSGLSNFVIDSEKQAVYSLTSPHILSSDIKIIGEFFKIPILQRESKICIQFIGENLSINPQNCNITYDYIYY